MCDVLSTESQLRFFRQYVLKQRVVEIRTL